MAAKSIETAAHAEALKLLRAASGRHGILASVTDVTNYRRIWARDGIISGLATLLSADDELITAFRATLETLARAQTKDGQIPSNAQIDEKGEITQVGYGTICGRVDPTLWFVIGACNYIIATGDSAFANKMSAAVDRALSLVRLWEFNGRGLIYVPQSGDWADEFVLHGYVLLEQLLRLWALRCHAKAFGEKSSIDRAVQLQELIRINYWPLVRNRNSAVVYHPTAFGNFAAEHGEPEFWLSSLTPGGYFSLFDAFSNALCVLLNVGDANETRSALDYGQRIQKELGHGMVPCFWPPIVEGNPGWRELQNNYKYEFKNNPYEYHNGGLWSMVNGWWGLALNAAGRTDEASNILAAVQEFNRKGVDDEEWGFYEYAQAKTGEPKGTAKITWSAAGMLLLASGLAEKHLFFG